MHGCLSGARHEGRVVDHIPGGAVVLVGKAHDARIAGKHMLLQGPEILHLVPGGELRAEALVYLFHDAGDF